MCECVLCFVRVCLFSCAILYAYCTYSIFQANTLFSLSLSLSSNRNPPRPVPHPERLTVCVRSRSIAIRHSRAFSAPHLRYSQVCACVCACVVQEMRSCVLYDRVCFLSRFIVTRHSRAFSYVHVNVRARLHVVCVLHVCILCIKCELYYLRRYDTLLMSILRHWHARLRAVQAIGHE